jgi:hypothetical protein
VKNQALVFGLLGAGGILLVKAVTGSSFADILAGHPAAVANTGQNLLGSGLAGVGQSIANLPSSGTGGLPALPYGTPLKGTAAQEWASAILKAVGAPATQANLSSMQAWFQHEGGGGQNNPLNTTLSAAGATGSINSAGVKNYSSPAAGVQATVQTLRGYPAIVTALQSGQGLSSSSPGVAGELSEWSGGGYSSL